MERTVRCFGWKLGLATLLAGLANLVCAAAPSPTAHQLLEDLNRVRLDTPQSYKVSDIYVRRDAIRIHLEHGRLVFFEPVRGQITGAVFEGAGEALVLPPDRMERAQLLKFSGSPILTESFSSAYFRFTDSTFVDIIRQIRAGNGRPDNASEVIERWAPLLPGLNRLHSLRILLDYLQAPPAPYFYAGINGDRLGAFDIIVDDRRAEPVLVGQLRWEREQRYYDVWASFERRESVHLPPQARITDYDLNATITPERLLQVECTLTLGLQREQQQTVVFQLSRFLQVEDVSELPSAGADPQALEFLQNATLTAEEARYRGSDIVVVALPARDSADAPNSLQRRLRFRYHGDVISDVGGGVLHVGARDTWYPTVEPIVPANFVLRFRYPQALDVVAVGRRQSLREDGNWKESVWVTDVALPLAGFNVGSYDHWSEEQDARQVTVYGNRRLEPELADALRPPVALPAPSLNRPDRSLEAPMVLPPPEPTLQLETVGRQVGGALHYFTQLFGSVPYPELNATQIPGRLAQGYPGLLYLPTLSFLSEREQSQLGMNEEARQHFSQVTPPHETAHQWWGNWLWMSDYRSQWLSEGLASYAALLYLDQQPGGAGTLRRWLERYRGHLLADDEENRSVESTGALALGARLNSSHSPGGYVAIIYNKGPWVIHMLRELLRDPKTGSDALFLGVLRDLVAHGGSQSLDNRTFQRSFEAVLPKYADLDGSGSLDWFFQQWVYDTGVPRYELTWDARQQPDGRWLVEGMIAQSSVPDVFTMRVPLYARYADGLQRLGSVVVTGRVASFELPAAADPDDVILDPELTVLSVTR